MQIGILQTGLPPGDLAAAHGTYADMLGALIGPGFTTRTYDVQAGELPASPEACDGYLVTGSSAGAYEDLPWIAPLAAFLRRARGQAPLVGICFGHQIMAQAFGGRVEKSDRGWGLGLHDYAIREDAPWAAGRPGFTIVASHQDQVVALPPDATILAASDFTQYAALGYGTDALSFQGHPEFDPAFAGALLTHRALVFPADRVATALASLDAPNDRDRVGGWIRDFFRTPRTRAVPPAAQADRA